MASKNTSLRPQAETSAWNIYGRLLRYLKPYVFWFCLSVVGYIVYACANVMYSHVMEKLVAAIESDDAAARWWVPTQIVIATLLRGAGMFVGGYFMAKVAFNVVNDLRVQVFNHMTHLPVSAFDARPSGHMISLITYNINGVTVAATDALKKGIREGATVIGLLAWLFYLDWKLTLMFLSVAPIMGLLVTKVAKRLRRLSSKVQDSVGDITQVSSEMINGYKVMRTFGGEAYEQQRFTQASKKNYAQNMKIVITSAANAPVMHLLIAVSMSLLIYAALSFMQLESTAAFIGYITAVGLIVTPIRQLGEVAPMILKGVAAADSVFTLLDEAPEADTGTRTLGRVKGEVEFRDVSFRYPSQERAALSHFNLRVEPGKVVALVGKSGSGKSTLVNLLPRFYDPRSGDILLDSVSIRELRLANLREQIALVNQQVVLFEGSVADNIAYGRREHVSAEQIKQAADLAFVTEFVQNLPQGFDTLIGEGGARLSGGQRQRIAIARAILKDAPILILDEATSALDNESEHMIQAALESVMKGRTTFVVAHRLSTIERADLIVVMADGEIVEQGTHQALLALNGHYARLHSRQFDDDSER
ncbi:lipid A export permease/ATP-binding protein MsbA [Cellvibrio japonicus]|uniref:Lipid A export permease/ATP-binding protein MsbA n=1 Tax=Cellvibrio japonicus (strain Ueda107) TaxID=498211 RepID=B3PIZ7_CELJU|nr:lipid A export permease/ATP-binding protein MsbA [Cellvibrio japonicus]ACE83134.1 lipid A export permease/ATP-binding protein MsbA [Cellvibrio japonicus Ueda107]QEI11202.1 lipid A export permease/ATP-binding protein MsbA [Cellvibrio japonicus]QEI14776.1 lipid A export permease/ATP-binding protein MsbA [Cellvibrio japonicus]QEI18356.1 lipid A export permease/ATP-binding protein MsbA [Cellvibrio japonicus]